MQTRALFLAALLAATPSLAQVEDVLIVKKKEKVTKDDCPKLRKKLDELYAQRKALGVALIQLEADRKSSETLTVALNAYADTYFTEFETHKKNWTAAKCLNYLNPTCTLIGCDKYPVEQEVEKWWPPKHAVLAEKISEIQKVSTEHAKNFLANLVKGNANLTAAPAVEVPASLALKIADVPTPENVDPEWKKADSGSTHPKPQTWKWYDARPNAPVARNIAQWTKDVAQAYVEAKRLGDAVMERCLNEITIELSAEGNQVCSQEMIDFTNSVDKDDPARERIGKVVDNKLQTYGQRVKYAEMNADDYLTNRADKSNGDDKLKIKSKDTLTSVATALRNSSDPRFRCAGMQALIEGLKKGLGRKGKAMKSDKVLADESIDLDAVHDEVKTKLPKNQTECSKS